MSQQVTTQRDQRMRKAALMVAEAKMTDKEIAAKLEIAPATLTMWKKSPLFREMVSTFADRIIEGGVQGVIDSIMADGPTNISFLKEVRDGRFTDDPKRMSVRLKASEMLFDRQAPKQDKIADNAVKIVIGGRLLGQMVRAMRNDGAEVDAEFEEIDEQMLGPKTIEDLMAREQAEAAALAAADDDEDE